MKHVICFYFSAWNRVEPSRGNELAYGGREEYVRGGGRE